jgi:hypothetical protein
MFSVTIVKFFRSSMSKILCVNHVLTPQYGKILVLLLNLISLIILQFDSNDVLFVEV